MSLSSILRIGLFFSLFAIIQAALATTSPQKIPVKQSELPGYISMMASPDFWLQKIPNSGEVIWSPEKIRDYNQDNLRKGRILNPFIMGTSINIYVVKGFMDEDLAFLRRYIKYDTTGMRRRDPEFSDYLKKLMGYESLLAKDTLSLRYAIVVNRDTELRYFPTEMKIFRNREDREFEILKKTHLEPFTPVAVLWESDDRNWFYVETPFSRGWLKQESVVVGSISEVRDFFVNHPKGVVVNPLALVYTGDGKLKNEYPSLALPMGTPVYYRDYDPTQEFTEIIVPQSEEGGLIPAPFYVRTQDIRDKPLPFTYENLTGQAFKFLGSSYSWGGSYDKTDCSLFLYRVFGSFGFSLPRSSSQQIVSLNNRKVSAEADTDFQDLSPLKTIAYVPGPTHILLYLGKHEGRDFFIHSTWSYYDREGNEYLIRSVVVSDLSLGEGSKWGDLEKRISLLGFF